MDTLAVSPIGSNPPTPSPAVESAYLIDTYGIPSAAARLAVPPVYVQPVTPLVPPAAPVAGVNGSVIDTYA